MFLWYTWKMLGMPKLEEQTYKQNKYALCSQRKNSVGEKVLNHYHRIWRCTNRPLRGRSQICLEVPGRLHKGETAGTFKGSQGRAEQSKRKCEIGYATAGEVSRELLGPGCRRWGQDDEQMGLWGFLMPGWGIILLGSHRCSWPDLQLETNQNFKSLWRKG